MKTVNLFDRNHKQIATLDEMYQHWDKSAKRHRSVYPALFLTIFLVGVLAIPALLKELRGHSKVFLMLQNLKAKLSHRRIETTFPMLQHFQEFSVPMRNSIKQL